MKTKIVALLSALVFCSFFVFLNLSCQKDNGVESAGNMSHNSNTVKKEIGKVSDNVPRLYHQTIIIDRKVDGSFHDNILNVTESSPNEPGWAPDPVEFVINEIDPPVSGEITYDITLRYYWEGCSNTYQWSLYGHIACFVIGNSHKDPPWSGVIFNTFLTKPWAEESGYVEKVYNDVYLRHPIDIGENEQYSYMLGYAYYIGGAWDNSKIITKDK